MSKQNPIIISISIVNLHYVKIVFLLFEDKNDKKISSKLLSELPGKWKP
jgi:hypothetical protein